MKVVLYILTNLRRTGPVNILYDLIKYVDRTAYDVKVLALCTETGESRKGEFEAEGVAVSSMNLPKGAGFLAGAPSLRRVADRIKPDIVHCIGFRADVLAALFLPHIPKVSSQLNYPFDDYVMTYGNIVGTSMARLTAFALRRYNFTIACSQDVATKLTQHGIPAKVIYNAIDTARFVPVSQTQRAQYRHQLKLWADVDLVFVFVGVLTDRKQPLIALEAFRRFQALHPKAALLILGDGPLLSSCKQLAQGLRVHFAGNVSDTLPYLAASDVYIATSKAEGLPVSVLEALALRLPVVLSDINPHREILSIDSNAGFLARTGSIEDTLVSMQKIAAGNLEDMGSHSRKIIEQELNALVMSSKFRDVYDVLAN